MSPPQRKVAVLGGGIAAMAAAFELTEPHLGGRYQVTVYQPGWRLGGKCASGRGGPPEQRIEEHGLHVWFGFYDNAFSLIDRCYEDWRQPLGAPMRTWRQAFEPCDDIVLLEQWRGRWSPWHLRLPPDDLDPGTERPVTAWQFLERLFRWLLEEWDLVRERQRTAISPRAARAGRELHHGWIPRVAAEIGHRFDRFERDLGSHFIELASKLADAHASNPVHQPSAPHHLGRIEELLTHFRHWLFSHVLEDAIDNDHIRRYAILFDFWTAVVTGMIADHVFEDGFGSLNREDLRAWLRRHRASELTLQHAAFIQALYDLVFAYHDGDKGRPDLAAGKALQAMIRIVSGYKGAVLWKMRAGMGDTVFTPLYDVLCSRGVRFCFFHPVTRLGLSNDRRSIAAIEVQPQVRLKDGYDPFVTVEGLRCWPSQPKWELIERGDELQARRVNLETELNPLGLDSIELNAGEDFDEVVLAISVGALNDICAELADANERFKEMLENSYTVMTEGIQLWLRRTAAALGWPYETSIATSYVERADTYSSMRQLLERESWPAGARPAEVVYLCGVLKHDQITTQADADARVRANALGFLRNDAGPLWPRAVGREFDWDQLIDRSGGHGEERLDAQFLRANFQPTERYVMTRADTVQYRLRADQSGFENLKLAGDWTRNGLDGGSVEAAVTSGMQAARAISGSPAHIPGERGWLVDD